MTAEAGGRAEGAHRGIAHARVAVGSGRPDVHERSRLRAGFGTVLREARRARRLSAAELARRCDCSVSLIEQLERGTCRPRVRTVTVLAYALDPDAPGPLAEQLRQAAAARISSNASSRGDC